MWALLSEECMVPKGSDTGFTEKLHDAQKKGGALTAVKGIARSGGFQMAHFAGQVTYSTVGWLDKNKDPLSGDLLVLMQFSDNEVLRTLFTEEQAAPGGKQKIKSNKFKGVVDTFRVQLTELYNVLDSSQTHFVRCFKPNDNKASRRRQPLKPAAAKPHTLRSLPPCACCHRALAAQCARCPQRSLL